MGRGQYLSTSSVCDNMAEEENFFSRDSLNLTRKNCFRAETVQNMVRSEDSFKRIVYDVVSRYKLCLFSVL